MKNNHVINITKSVVLDREDVYQKLCAKFEARRLLGEGLVGKSNHAQLAKLLSLRSHETRGFCSTMYKLELIFELPGHSLEAELTQRKKIRSYFSASALEQILKDTLSSLKHLSTAKLIHGNLRPSYILITPSCRSVLLDNLNELEKEDSLAPHKANLGMGNSLYLAPAIFERVCLVHPSQKYAHQNSDLNNRIQVPETLLSCDLFALGLIILEAGLLKEVPRMVCSPIICRHQGTLDWKVLDELIDEFSERFPRLRRAVTELLSRTGPARTDPNYLANSRIEESIGLPEIEFKQIGLEDSWEGRGVSGQEAMDLFRTDQPDVDFDGEFLLKIKGTIFNSDHELDPAGSKDSFLEDSLIVAHHITPAAHSQGLKQAEQGVKFSPIRNPEVKNIEPIYKFVDNYQPQQPPTTTVLSSLLRDPHKDQAETSIPQPHVRTERITFNPQVQNSPVSIKQAQIPEQAVPQQPHGASWLVNTTPNHTSLKGTSWKSLIPSDYKSGPGTS